MTLEGKEQAQKIISKLTVRNELNIMIKSILIYRSLTFILIASFLFSFSFSSKGRRYYKLEWWVDRIAWYAHWPDEFLSSWSGKWSILGCITYRWCVINWIKQTNSFYLSHLIHSPPHLIGLICIFNRSGKANAGIKDATVLGQTVKGFLEKATFSIFTFGYGTDHDDKMLKEISTAGNGMYYFVSNAEEIPTAVRRMTTSIISLSNIYSLIHTDSILISLFSTYTVWKLLGWVNHCSCSKYQNDYWAAFRLYHQTSPDQIY